EDHSAILDLPFGNDFQVAYLGFGVRAPVRLDEADDDVHAFAAEGVRILQHRVGLADPRGRADVNAQTRAFSVLNPSEHLLAARSNLLVHSAHRTRSSTQPVDALRLLYESTRRLALFLLALSPAWARSRIIESPFACTSTTSLSSFDPLVTAAGGRLTT